MFQSPIDVVTLTTDLVDEKQHKFFSYGLELRSLNQGIGRAIFLLGASEEDFFPSLFQLVESACLPWPEDFSSRHSALLPLSSHLLL